MLQPPQDVMLARSVTRLPAAGGVSGGYLYEPKWDGYRALVFRTDGRVVVQSRRGSDLTAAFPDIAAAAEVQLPPGCVLDGELVVWTGDGLDFSALQRRAVVGTRSASALAARHPASLVVFDLLALDDQDLRRQPLRRRRAELERVSAAFRPPIQLTPGTTSQTEARRMLEDYATARVGVEGLVIKRLGDPYQPGRRGWLKLRIRNTAEAIVGAVIGPLHQPQQLVLGLPDENGTLTVAGRTGPLPPAERDTVAPLLREPTSPHPWPAELPAGRLGRFGGSRRAMVAVTLVEPSLVVEVSADTAFEYGKWRHVTAFVRTRPDLRAEDVSVPRG